MTFIGCFFLKKVGRIEWIQNASRLSKLHGMWGKFKTNPTSAATSALPYAARAFQSFQIIPAWQTQELRRGWSVTSSTHIDRDAFFCNGGLKLLQSKAMNWAKLYMVQSMRAHGYLWQAACSMNDHESRFLASCHAQLLMRRKLPSPWHREPFPEQSFHQLGKILWFQALA